MTGKERRQLALQQLDKFMEIVKMLEMTPLEKHLIEREYIGAKGWVQGIPVDGEE